MSMKNKNENESKGNENDNEAKEFDVNDAIGKIEVKIFVNLKKLVAKKVMNM